MSRCDRSRTRRAAGSSAARLLVVLAAFAGLFAMHGMGEHGVMLHEGAAMAGMQHADGAAPELLVDLSAGVLADVTPVVGAAGAAVLTAADDPAQGAGAAMALCLAMLAGLMLLLARGRRPRVGLAPITWTDPLGIRIASRTRGPDPPDLFALSVQRC